ncbi:MAG: HNH endonuclease [Thermoanaerobaculia bacterium]
MLARDIHKALGEGSIGFSLKFAAGKTQSAGVTLPNEKVIHRFVVAMRPLLSRESAISLWTIWKTLRGHPRLRLQAGEISEIEEAFRDLERGPIGYRFNETDATQRDIYERIGRGAYFDEQTPDAQAMKALAGSPALPMLWFSFFSFSESAYPLAGRLFEKASAIEEIAPRDLDGPWSCIFCRGDDGGFRSEEHIFPESLAGDSDVLPKGYVCDRCNAGPLSEIDEALVNFGPVALYRTLFLPLTKKGKFPRGEAGPLVFEKKEPRRIVVSRKDGRNPFEDIRSTPDGQTRFTLKGGERPGWRQIARALAKIALEYVAFDEGHERACSPEFDAVRRFILDGSDFRSYLGFRTIEVKPEATVRIQSFPGAADHLVEVVVFGIPFFITLREIDVAIPVPEADLAAAGAVLIPLSGEPRPIGAVQP